MVVGNGTGVEGVTVGVIVGVATVGRADVGCSVVGWALVSCGAGTCAAMCAAVLRFVGVTLGGGVRDGVLGGVFDGTIAVARLDGVVLGVGVGVDVGHGGNNWVNRLPTMRCAPPSLCAVMPDSTCPCATGVRSAILIGVLFATL